MNRLDRVIVRGSRLTALLAGLSIGTWGCAPAAATGRGESAPALSAPSSALQAPSPRGGEGDGGPGAGGGRPSEGPSGRSRASGESDGVRGPAPALAPIRFRDVTDRSGITFVHCSGNSPEKEFPTCLGSGVALLDYDRDGWLDIYFATTRNLPFDAPDRSPGNRLYRNRHDGTFEDVTTRTGVGFHGFCHGVTVGDVDNDGWPDLFLANWGPNVLYRNNGDGTFRDVSAASGLAGPASGWSCGAAFLDYDNDGRLDLYVSHYGHWSLDAPRPYCGDKARNLRTICTPTVIEPARHVLYRNRGDGTFEDVTVRAGVARRDGRGMGVIAADLDRDGRIDLYVANDKCPNFLFRNRGDGTFEDVTETSGAAGNEAGEYQGSMGVDAQDLDGDGLPEMIVTNFRGDGAALYRNFGRGNFLEVGGPTGLLRDTKPYVGWGVALEDFDNDGHPDVLLVNGHVDDNLELFEQDIPQAEPAQLWWNRGTSGTRIALASVADPGPFFAVPHVARGAAFGDLDNDGDLDVVIGRLDKLPAVLLNESPPRSWIRLELVGRRSNHSAIGTAVEVHAGGRVFHRQVKGGGSYLSANDPRVLIGLGDAERVESVEVRWPSGARSLLAGPAPRRTHVLHEPDTTSRVTSGAGRTEARR